MQIFGIRFYLAEIISSFRPWGNRRGIDPSEVYTGWFLAYRSTPGGPLWISIMLHWTCRSRRLLFAF